MGQFVLLLSLSFGCAFLLLAASSTSQSLQLEVPLILIRRHQICLCKKQETNEQTVGRGKYLQLSSTYLARVCCITGESRALIYRLCHQKRQRGRGLGAESLSEGIAKSARAMRFGGETERSGAR